jgi:hypothetical protein
MVGVRVKERIYFSVLTQPYLLPTANSYALCVEHDKASFQGIKASATPLLPPGAGGAWAGSAGGRRYVQVGVPQKGRGLEAVGSEERLHLYFVQRIMTYDRVIKHGLQSLQEQFIRIFSDGRS